MSNASTTVDEAMQRIGHDLGETLATNYPAVQHPDNLGCVPAAHLDALTDHLLVMLAETIQSWIHAGSERDVTISDEELYIAIRNHLKEWSA